MFFLFFKKQNLISMVVTMEINFNIPFTPYSNDLNSTIGAKKLNRLPSELLNVRLRGGCRTTEEMY